MPGSLASIADLVVASPGERAACLDLLVPGELRRRYRLPGKGSWQLGTGTHRWNPGERSGTLRVEVWPDLEGEDPALALDLADHRFGWLEMAWVVINDIDGPRFNVDRDSRGHPLALGSTERNRAEELRALAAGLTPNQVRPGLRAFRAVVHGVESLVRALGADTLQVVPMAYHNALQYERYGFTYGSEEVEPAEIHRGFQPGNELHRRLDGSSPFRAPGLATTIRGRSWAIHDGILGDRWLPPSMYKFTEREFTTCTFPDAVW